jgi:hypothetical protein
MVKDLQGSSAGESFEKLKAVEESCQIFVNHCWYEGMKFAENSISVRLQADSGGDVRGRYMPRRRPPHGDAKLVETMLSNSNQMAYRNICGVQLSVRRLPGR